MITAEILRGLHRCGCASCTSCYLREIEADTQVAELLDEIEHLLIDEYGVKVIQ